MLLLLPQRPTTSGEISTQISPPAPPSLDWIDCFFLIQGKLLAKRGSHNHRERSEVTSCVLMVKTRPQVNSVLADAIFDLFFSAWGTKRVHLCPSFKDWMSLHLRTQCCAFSETKGSDKYGGLNSADAPREAAWTPSHFLRVSNKGRCLLLLPYK